jgi:uncharacterized protein DUF3857/transglutaminase superfamily protein
MEPVARFVLPCLLAASLVILFSLTAFAGDDWRAVTPEELAMKTAKVEADADAEAIFWEVRIDDSSEENLSMQHYVRVKIFTDRGREKYSKFDIPFSKGMKIKDIAARVIKADGSVVEIQKDDIFEREIVRANGLKVRAKSFAVPNLEPGVIVEYRYRELISDAGASGMHLKFQRDIPVQTLTYFYKPFNKKNPSYQAYNFKDTKFVEGEKGFWVATRTNVPALKEEPQMPPEDQVIPWMLLQKVGINVSSQGLNFTISIKDPNNPSSYWGAVGTDKSFLAKFMNKPDKEVKQVAEEITSSADTPDGKLRKLYDYCQTTIRNTSFDSSISDDQRKKLPENKSIADVLKHKTASAGFIDMLFGSMANSLGYETRIAFSGNRSEMFFRPEMTNEAFIHPAAIAVKVGENWEFFNPGTRFLPYGMLLWYEESVWALLVGEKNFSWVQIPLSGADKSVTRRTGKFKLLEDGTLEGDVRIEYNGQSAVIYRMENYDKSDNKREEDLKEEIKRRLSTVEVSDVTIENLTDPDKPLVQKLKVRVPQYAQKTGKRLFLQPSFFEYGQPPMFSSATRKYEVCFQYPWSTKDEIEIGLPPGYMPDNAEQPFPIEAGEVSRYDVHMGITKDNRTLIVKREFFFGGGGNLVFAQTSYAKLKTLFDQLHKNDEHTITLKQAVAAAN